VLKLKRKTQRRFFGNCHVRVSQLSRTLRQNSEQSFHLAERGSQGILLSDMSLPCDVASKITGDNFRTHSRREKGQVARDCSMLHADLFRSPV
jgi:hypothetical protein